MRPSPGLQVVSYNYWPQALAEALAEPLALPGAQGLCQSRSGPEPLGLSQSLPGWDSLRSSFRLKPP